MRYIIAAIVAIVFRLAFFWFFEIDNNQAAKSVTGLENGPSVAAAGNVVSGSNTNPLILQLFSDFFMGERSVELFDHSPSLIIQGAVSGVLIVLAYGRLELILRRQRTRIV